VLLSWPNAPIMLRTSAEIDAYPENAKQWEITQKALGDDLAEASEEINVFFGAPKAQPGIRTTASVSMV
jgi:hypothetical protein